MKLGVMGAVFGGIPNIDDAVRTAVDLGLEAIELPAGYYPGDPWKLLDIADSPGKIKELRTHIESLGIVVMGIAGHGNPLDPDREIRGTCREMHRKQVLLAEGFGTRLVTFSGLPGGSPTATEPNWILAPWPDKMREMLQWQWDVEVAPYWQEQNEFAAAHNVVIGVEAHPNNVVSRPRDIVRIRELCGKQLGANLDLSHFGWLHTDPLAIIRYLGRERCIFHFHAKDWIENSDVMRINGPMGAESFDDELNRPWSFANIGLGHGADFWGPVLRTLRQVGYDGVVSIEHEDAKLDGVEGLKKAIATLRPLLPVEPAGTPHWFKQE